MGAELRVSMLLQANAAQAKAEIGAMRAEVKSLADVATSTGRAVNGAGADMAAIGPAATSAASGLSDLVAGEAEWGSLVQMTRAAIQPMVGEYYALGAAVQQVAAYEEMGALSASEAAQAHDLLARQTIALMDRMQAAGVTLDGTTAAIGRQETMVQQLIAQTTGLNAVSDGTIADTLRHGQALDSLRAKYNPLFAASRQYEQDLRDIAEAERLGAISAMEASAARDRAAAAMAPATGQMRGFSGATQQTGFYVTQLGYQLNDISMMIAAGQNPFVLMMQQGSQVTQVFQMMRAQGVGLGAALRGTFTAFLSPMSLATMAVIGFGAAAVQWLMSSSEEALTFEEAMNRASEAVGRMQQNSASLSANGLESLRAKYGEVTREIRHMIEAQDRADERAARRALTQASSEFTALAESSYIGSFFVGQNEATAVANLRNELGATLSEAIALNAALEALKNAGSPAEQANAYAMVAAALESIALRSGDASGEVGALADKALEAEANARQLDAQINGVGQTAAEAAQQAERIKTAIDSITSRSITIAVNLVGRASGIPAALSGWAGTTLGTMEAIASGGEPIFVSPRPREAPTNIDFGVETSAGGGGGGASKEANAVASLIKQQERELELLRETDPVKKEMIRYREQMVTATDAEKAKVEELISARLAEQAAMNSLRSVSQMTGDALIDALMGGKDAAEQLIEALLRAGLQAALLGTGPLAGMFGSSESGGLLGMVFAPLMKAEGGYISGPGTSTSDSIPAWLSDGEYVINAAATAANLPLLEMINNGGDISDLFQVVTGQKLHAYASGGSVGTGSSMPAWGRTFGVSAGSAAASAGRQAPIVQIRNYSPEPIRETSGDGMDADGAVTLIVGRATARGKFDRQNSSRYGIGTKVTKR
ncbi:phage tail length tape measure family protein [Fuscovulum blasticum]|uniref:phage tail length tape measure family protein n=1 Tax=Fuscovulum blasticum TaxID=1075 RepID=UPI000F4FF3A2|nr:phage tail length tape measure family protein [Fuscovulum blasticum]